MDDKNTVDQNEVEEAAEAPEQHGFHEVDGDDSVLARSSGDYDASAEDVDPDKVDYVTENEPTKYEGAAQPVQNPLQTAPVPEQHEHTAYDTESRHLTMKDADFDADHDTEVNPYGDQD